MFPFSLSYLTCLRGLAAFGSDVTQTGVEARESVRKAEEDASRRPFLHVIYFKKQTFTVVSCFQTGCALNTAATSSM